MLTYMYDADRKFGEYEKSVRVRSSLQSHHPSQQVCECMLTCAELDCMLISYSVFVFNVDVRRTHSIHVAFFWMQCDFRVWVPSWSGWPLALISCESCEFH